MQCGATLEQVRRQLEQKASAFGSKEIESDARPTSLSARGTRPPHAGGHAAERPAEATRHATEQEQRAGGSGDGTALLVEQTTYRNLFPEAAPAVCEAGVVLSATPAAFPA